jgi:hypothetical protein
MKALLIGYCGIKFKLFIYESTVKNRFEVKVTSN